MAMFVLPDDSRQGLNRRMVAAALAHSPGGCPAASEHLSKHNIVVAALPEDHRREIADLLASFAATGTPPPPLGPSCIRPPIDRIVAALRVAQQ